MLLLFQILIRVSLLPGAFYLQFPLFHLWYLVGGLMGIVFHCVWKEFGGSMFRWYLDFAVPFSELFPLILVPWTFSWKDCSSKALDLNANQKAAERFSTFSQPRQ